MMHKNYSHLKDLILVQSKDVLLVVSLLFHFVRISNGIIAELEGISFQKYTGIKTGKDDSSFCQAVNSPYEPTLEIYS